MNFDSIRRHPALTVLRVEKAQSNDLDDRVPWHGSQCLTSLVEQTSETFVGGAARMRDLRDQGCILDFEIPDNQVDVGVAVLGNGGDESRAKQESLELGARNPVPVRKRRLRSRQTHQLGDRDWDGNRIDLRGVGVGPDLHWPPFHTAHRLGSDGSRRDQE